MRVATWDNTKLTEEQVEAMKSEYPPEMIDTELGGFFPDYGVSMFPPGHLEACVAQELYDAAYLALHPEDPKEHIRPGWQLVEDPRHGVTLYEAPAKPGRVYAMGGDPGTGNYPGRNAAGVMVADITEKPFKLVYFHWVSGNGSLNPFLQSYKHAIQVYNPVLRGIDATGPQKMIDEIAFTNHGIATDRINFSTDKDAMLNALAYDVTNHNWKIPTIKGLIRQASTYTREDDKKLAQDLVMTWAQISFLARFMPAEVTQNATTARSNHRNRRIRASGRRR